MRMELIRCIVKPRKVPALNGVLGPLNTPPDHSIGVPLLSDEDQYLPFDHWLYIVHTELVATDPDGHKPHFSPKLSGLGKWMRLWTRNLAQPRSPDSGDLLTPSRSACWFCLQVLCRVRALTSNSTDLCSAACSVSSTGSPEFLVMI